MDRQFFFRTQKYDFSKCTAILFIIKKFTPITGITAIDGYDLCILYLYNWCY